MIRVTRRYGSWVCDECDKRPALFDVKIKRTVHAMCKICLKELKERTFAALDAYRIFLRDKFQYSHAQKK